MSDQPSPLPSLIYAAGLIAFAITWYVYRWERSQSKSSGSKADKGKVSKPKGSGRCKLPFPLAFDKPLQDELLVYFWYLRATCFSLACAMVLSGSILLVDFGIAWVQSRTLPQTWLWRLSILITLGLACYFLISLGKRYETNVDECIQMKNP